MWKHLRVFCAHIEWSTASMFIGLGSLAVALGTTNWPPWAVCATVLGVLILAVFTAKAAHTQRSIDRITEYDRDFKELKAERRKAENYLLKKVGKESDVDDVLDFF